MINLYNGTDPIINPWLFYAADVIHGIKIVMILVCIALALTSLLYLGCFSDAMENAEIRYSERQTYIDRAKKHLHKFKVFLVGTIVSIILTILIPSKNLIYTMAISSMLTPDTVEYVYETTGKTANDIINGGSEIIKETIDYGIDKINELRKGE